jgi:hypothetical protein
MEEGEKERKKKIKLAMGNEGFLRGWTHLAGCAVCGSC